MLAITALAVVVSIVLIWWLRCQLIQIQHQTLISQAQLVAAMLDVDDVNKLNGNEGDKATLEFLILQNAVQTVKATLPELRHVYLFRQVNGKMIFIADSDDTSIDGYDTYGDDYTEATEELKFIFIDGEPIIEGPITDRWGEWISGIAPIKDSNGQVIAVVGLDITFDSWYKRLFPFNFAMLVLALTTLLLFISGFVYWFSMSHWHNKARDADYIAHHDQMTGLHNRRFIMQLLAELMGKSQKGSKGFGLLFLDIDGLKKLNDSEGHPAGDQLIVRVANALTATRNASGGVGHTARIGGDEFVFVLPEITELAELQSIEGILKAYVEKPLQLAPLDKHYQPSCSIGCAVYPQDGQTLEQLLSVADKSMYINKTQTNFKL